MQSFRSRPGSSDMQKKTSPSAPNSRRSLSPSLRKNSTVSSNSIDSKPSKISERRPSPKSHFSQEKQRSVRVFELQETLRRTEEERSFALQELELLKEKKNEESLQSKDRIKMLEIEAEKAKESEGQMLESLFSQTKQLEQTKILLEEAKLEIRDLPSLTSQNFESDNRSLTSTESMEEIKMLRNELRLALQAEEESKKAMDDLAIALKEVTTEATQAKSELSETKSELEKAQHANNSLLQIAEQKLQDLLKEYEESAVAWKEKEDSFINCIKISEENIDKKDQEITRLTNSHKMSREETSKLRDIIKQSINEAATMKESLEIAQYQKFELEEQMSKKENALRQIKHDYESIKVSEAAALDSVRELKSLLASVSVVESKKSSNLSNFEFLRESKEEIDDRKISKDAKKFSSDRWTNMKPLAQQNGHRHSVGELDLFKERSYGNKDCAVSNAPDVGLPSFLYSDDKGLNTDDFDHLDGILLFSDAENEKKKKKTALRRFGDVLMRRSVRKT